MNIDLCVSDFTRLNGSYLVGLVPQEKKKEINNSSGILVYAKSKTLRVQLPLLNVKKLRISKSRLEKKKLDSVEQII